MDNTLGPEAVLSFADVSNAELEDIINRRAQAELEVSKEIKNGRSAPCPQFSDKEKAKARREENRKLAELKGGKLDITNEKALSEEALMLDQVGLAFSGGGIRSATFGLGVLQALGQLCQLRRVDYLSTVSGGGFIGAWLSALIHEKKSVSEVERILDPRRIPASPAEKKAVDPEQGNQEKEHNSIRWLRAYGNYLAPATGGFSMDTWTIVTTYLRNLFLNQVVLLFTLMAILLATRMVIELYTLLKENYGWQIVLLTFAFLAITFVWIAMHVKLQPTNKGETSKSYFSGMHIALLCFLLGGVCGTAILSSSEVVDFLTKYNWPFCYVVALSAGVLHALFHVKSIAAWLGISCNGWNSGEDYKSGNLQRTFAGFIAGLLGGATSYLCLHLIYSTASTVMFFDIAIPWQTIPVHLTCVFIPPLLLVFFVFTSFLHIGLGGSKLRPEYREWWSTFSAKVLSYAVAWLSMVGIVIYGPWLVKLLYENLSRVGALIGASWAGMVFASIQLAKSDKTSGTGKTSKNRIREIVTCIGPYLFLFGLAILLSCFASKVAYDVYAYYAMKDSYYFSSRTASQYLHDYNESKNAVSLSSNERESQGSSGGTQNTPFNIFPWKIPAFVLLGLGALVLFLLAYKLSYSVGVNLFSMHEFYANRLTRCYLGAVRSEKQRNANPLTDIDPDDDLKLHQLQRDSENKHCGPLHLINTSLNLVGQVAGTDETDPQKKLAWQERRAAPFTFSPMHAGCPLTGYRPVKEYAGGVRLGTAIATSGAAASPNMGYYSKPSVSALLTVFNVRLGAWYGNPRRDKKVWTNPNPPGGVGYLLNELLGKTTSESDYVYLSDGGHFDNSGLYELVRRRCRFIIYSDAGADPRFLQENLAQFIRKVRIDLGIRIEIDTNCLKHDEHGKAKSHIAIGRIRYGDVHPPSPTQGLEANKVVESIPFDDPNYYYENNQGILVVMHSNMTGDESTDLCNYRAENPDFPYESTADQFFSESQFESYRALGFHVCRSSLLGDQYDEIDKTNGKQRVNLAQPYEKIRNDRVATAAKQLSELSNRDFFTSLYYRWLPKPEEFVVDYVSQNEAYIQVQRALRQTESLRLLAYELYGDEKQKDWARKERKKMTQNEAGEKDKAERELAERHMVLEMLTILENTWFALDMDRNWLHPVHNGWRELYERWLTAPTVEKYWMDLSTEFSTEFQRIVRRVVLQESVTEEP